MNTRNCLLIIMVVGLLAVAGPSRGDPWKHKGGKGRGWGGIPPGLAKKPYGLPPGQAKKLFGSPYGAGQPYGGPSPYPTYQGPWTPYGMPQGPIYPAPLPPPVYPAPQPY